MLFTGDIEEKAESSLIKQYGKTNILQSNILKVAHHGSKSSSTEEFLELVNPQIALIGVGKNNLYGHPNDNVIKRITDLGVAIYRTDKNGEICIEVDKKFKIKKLQLYIKND
jgi:competence protein ComEC